MTGQLLEFLTSYGLPAAALLLAVGQMGLPLPTSLALLTLGALAGNGDADLVTAFIWALCGATFGDQAGFLAGRFVVHSSEGRPGFLGGLARKARAAEPKLEKWGGGGVFLTRWLFTPLGPAINIASGITGLSWARFTAWGVELARQAGLTLIGRAKGKRFIALAGLERLDFDADPDQVPEESKRSSRKASVDA